jgi:hypothetical protein
VEGVLSRENCCPLTGRWQKRFWLVPKGFGSEGPATENVRGRLALPVCGRKRRIGGASREGPSIGGTHQEREALETASKDAAFVSEAAEAENASSNADSLESCAGALAPSYVTVHASAPLTSRIERSSGARVENRLQKLVRRISLAACGEGRETLFERGRGSVRR